MIEYMDRNFGDIGALKEVLERFQDEIATNIDIKALHVGTLHQLEEVKKKKSMEDQISNLEKRVKQLEPIVTEKIIIPTTQEVMDLGGKT